jgi:hypothetical protein
MRFTKPVQLQLNIINKLGQTVRTETLQTEDFSQKFDFSNSPNGIYFIKAIVDGQCFVKKTLVHER